MTITYISIIFMLAGLLMYGFCTNPKLAEIGRILFFAGSIALAMGTVNFGIRIER